MCQSDCTNSGKTISVRGMEEVLGRKEHFLALCQCRREGVAGAVAAVWCCGRMELQLCILYFVGGWREARRDRPGRKEDH